MDTSEGKTDVTVRYECPHTCDYIIKPSSVNTVSIWHDMLAMKRQRVHWMFFMAKVLGLPVTVRKSGSISVVTPHREPSYMTLEPHQWPRALVELNKCGTQGRAWALKPRVYLLQATGTMWVHHSGTIHERSNANGAVLWEEWTCDECVRDL